MKYMRGTCNLDYSLHDYLFWCYNFGKLAQAQRSTSMMVLFISQ